MVALLLLVGFTPAQAPRQSQAADGRRAATSYGRVNCGRRRREPLTLVGDLGFQVVYRGGEFLNAFTLECGDDVVVVDAGASELAEELLRRDESRFEAGLDATVVLEGCDRLFGHRRDRFRSDQFFDVEGVAVAGILG